MKHSPSEINSTQYENIKLPNQEKLSKQNFDHQCHSHFVERFIDISMYILATYTHVIIPAILGIHRNPNQKESLKSSKGFLRAVLTGHGHSGPLKKLPKLHFLTPACNLISLGPYLKYFESAIY